MSETIDGVKIWCVVRVESSATFTGFSEERFCAIAFAAGDNQLMFSLPHDGRKIFNWHKVLWFTTSVIDEPSEVTT